MISYSATHTDFLVLGGGVAGLAAAWELGDRAILLEQHDHPGGLVRSVRLGDYWFDHVLHLLYFNDEETEHRVRSLLGSILVRCPPVAWVETLRGTGLFPIQLNLGGLDREAVVACISDLAAAAFADKPEARNFEQILLNSFGEALCELFLFPYNRKVWKRPLNSLAASGFTWNIAKPDFASVLRGALPGAQESASYNGNGWYPRPDISSPIRGMEVLSQALAEKVSDLRLGHRITAIDLKARRVVSRHDSTECGFMFEHCIVTAPLPKTIALCCDAPEELKRACAKLLRNRVFTGMFAIAGPRPCGRGHWRYYADESIIFTRVVYMHEFDPLAAPEDGWGLLVEIVEPAECPATPEDSLLNRIQHDLLRANVLSPDCHIVARKLLLIDPAYVVFTSETQAVVERATQFLLEHNVHCLGRYGRWEYSSMAQVMTDGFALGRALGDQTSQRERTTDAEPIPA